MRVLTLCLSFVSLALATSRTNAPPGALTVGKTQKYTTISQAVAALSNTTTSEQVIFIHPGTYAEQVYIPKLSGPLTVLGYTRDDKTYGKNQVTIVASESQKTQPNNDLTATLRVWTSDFKLYNVNVRNDFGEGSQAVAVSAQADKQGYYGCALTGYQDTLLANAGRHLYAQTYISGATDFIFGQRARAWFERCDIGVVPLLPDSKNNGTIPAHGWITASGRSTDDEGWYVINKSNVAAAFVPPAEGEDNNSGGEKSEVADGTYFLGRPWRNFARVVFQRTEMSRVVNPAGWAIWNVGDERTDRVFYGEFGNMGPGAKGERAEFVVELEKAVAVETVLGEGWAGDRYVDARYLR